MAYGTVNADVIGTSVAGSNLGAGNASSFKNRIINGAMVIDQRNAGASVTPTDGQYVLDRWIQLQAVASKYSVQQNAGSVTPPAGFRNYLGITSLSSYSVGAGEYFMTNQRIEGFNVADLMWGTANAKTITVSFWVRSSLTGTFGGSVTNAASNRSYPFTYTISSSNTWEYKTVTIPGDTTGTWATGNTTGMQLKFSLGVGSSLSGPAGAWAGADYASATGATSVVGTNGATFYITGVQLEVGESATGFDYRPYGTELALCQRYYYKLQAGTQTSSPFGVGFIDTATTAVIGTFFPVEMRTDPTALEQSGTAGDYRIRRAGSAVVCSSVPTFFSATKTSAGTTFTVGTSQTTGQACFGGNVTTNTGYLAWSAEL